MDELRGRIEMKKIIPVLALSGLLLVGCGKDEKGFIVIKNETDSPLTNVTIHYASPKVDEVVGTINPKSSYKYPLNYTYNETAIDLIYIDKNQKITTKTVVGYSAKYDKENVEVVIK